MILANELKFRRKKLKKIQVSTGFKPVPLLLPTELETTESPTRIKTQIFTFSRLDALHQTTENSLVSEAIY